MKREDKIFDAIRKKVLEKDEERRNEEEIKAMREANIEALTELTSLSRKEVEKIAEEVKKEHLLNQRKKQRRITTLIIVLAVSGFIVYLAVKPKPVLKLRVVEDSFTDNSQGDWNLVNSFNYKRTLTPNGYIFETDKDDWCYWDNVDITFPKNFDVEVTSSWLNGKYDSYGIGLHYSNTDYYAFLIRGDGAAGFGKIVNKEWVINDSWKFDLGRKGKNQTNLQKVEVRNGQFSYYINNNLVRSGTLDMQLNNLALRCCDQQQVAFQNVKVYDVDKNKVIFEDNFSKPSEQWNAESDISFESGFNDGKLTITSNYDNECNWPKSDKYLISDNCEIELTSVWISGELANYGLMLMVDGDNYYSFEYQNNGEARLVESRNNNYVYVQEYVKTPFEGDGKTAQTQKIIIKEGQISYFINNQKIKEVSANQSFPCYLGLRVCGKQTVAFDKLTIKYYE
ncbi:MAG: hypothetical protein U0W24_15650 [Bacteroidales bacterium]